MTVDEAKEALEELNEEGYDNDQIVQVLYVMFQRGQIDLDAFESLSNLCGYELTDEFKKMSPEEQKKVGFDFKEIDDSTKREIRMVTDEISYALYLLHMRSILEKEVNYNMYYNFDKISINSLIGRDYKLLDHFHSINQDIISSYFAIFQTDTYKQVLNYDERYNDIEVVGIARKGNVENLLFEVNKIGGAILGFRGKLFACDVEIEYLDEKYKYIDFEIGDMDIYLNDIRGKIKFRVNINDKSLADINGECHTYDECNDLIKRVFTNRIALHEEKIYKTLYQYAIMEYVDEKIREK